MTNAAMKKDDQNNEIMFKTFRVSMHSFRQVSAVYKIKNYLFIYIKCFEKVIKKTRQTKTRTALSSNMYHVLGHRKGSGF